jgi:RimJ/RimL family protein N-acetyltransferase
MPINQHHRDHEHQRYLLRPEAHARLLEALGDTPCTVVAGHLLRRGVGRAYVAGDPAAFEAAVVQATFDPPEWPATEPDGFGSHAEAMWAVLREMGGWHCVLVDRDCAPALGARIEAATGRAAGYYGEVRYALTTPAAILRHEAVRRLTPDDVALLGASPEPELRGGGWGSAGRLLQEGVAAGAIVDGELVAIAYTCARSPRHAEVAVHTLEPWRRRGLAGAAASLVCRQVQEEGQTPVWSTGEDNRASQAVARKLGFTEVARGAYVIPHREPEAKAGT